MSISHTARLPEDLLLMPSTLEMTESPLRITHQLVFDIRVTDALGNKHTITISQPLTITSASHLHCPVAFRAKADVAVTSAFSFASWSMFPNLAPIRFKSWSSNLNDQVIHTLAHADLPWNSFLLVRTKASWKRTRTSLRTSRFQIRRNYRIIGLHFQPPWRDARK